LDIIFAGRLTELDGGVFALLAAHGWRERAERRRRADGGTGRGKRGRAEGRGEPAG